MATEMIDSVISSVWMVRVATIGAFRGTRSSAHRNPIPLRAAERGTSAGPTIHTPEIDLLALFKIQQPWFDLARVYGWRGCHVSRCRWPRAPMR